MKSTDLLRRMVSLFGEAAPKPLRKRTRQLGLSLEALEERKVLSQIGGLGSVTAMPLSNHANGRTLSVDTAKASTLPMTSSSHGMQVEMIRGHHKMGRGHHMGPHQQLDAQMATLRVDMIFAQTGSTVTVAQRTALKTDLRSLEKSGFRVDKVAVDPVVTSLLTTLADGSYNKVAGVSTKNHNDFKALFAGSSVSQATIDTTYQDLVTVARGLNISTKQLATLTTDQAAVQASLKSLGITSEKGHEVSLTNLLTPPGTEMGSGPRQEAGQF